MIHLRLNPNVVAARATLSSREFAQIFQRHFQVVWPGRGDPRSHSGRWLGDRQSLGMQRQASNQRLFLAFATRPVIPLQLR